MNSALAKHVSHLTSHTESDFKHDWTLFIAYRKKDNLKNSGFI